MKKSAKIIGAVAIIAVMIIAGYLKFGTVQTDNSTKTIGLILPLSGQYADFGEKAEKAIKLAFKDTTNAKFIIEDSQFDTKATISAYQKLTAIDHADMIISFASIAAMEALADQINNSKTLTIQITEANTPKDDYIFQVSPYSYPLFSRLGEVADKEYESVALVYSNEDFGIKDADFFKKTFPKNKIAYESAISAGTDYRTEVTKLLSTNPKAVSFFMSEEEGTKFLKEFIAQGGNEKTKLVCNTLVEMSIAQYTKTLGNDIFNGCLSTNIPNLTTIEFKDKFKAEYNADLTFGTDFAYDAAVTARNLVTTPKSNWLNEIKKTSFDGASGKVEFDGNGTRVPAIEDRIFTDGQFVKR